MIGEMEHEQQARDLRISENLSEDEIRNLSMQFAKSSWNPNTEFDWNLNIEVNPYLFASKWMPFINYAPYKSLPKEKQDELQRLLSSEYLTGLVYAEQALLKLTSMFATQFDQIEPQIIASIQSADEAKHIFCLTRYMDLRSLELLEVDPYTKLFFEKVEGSPEFDMKVLRSQILAENVGLFCFNTLKNFALDPLLRQISGKIMNDEARHLNYGNLFLRDRLANLSKSEVEARESSLIESCELMRESLKAFRWSERFGFDPDDVDRLLSRNQSIVGNRKIIFTRFERHLATIEFLTPRLASYFREVASQNVV